MSPNSDQKDFEDFLAHENIIGLSFGALMAVWARGNIIRISFRGCNVCLARAETSLDSHFGGLMSACRVRKHHYNGAYEEKKELD